jgi:23S rRNA (guanosine2251-2'-O)-methyltransferase
MADASSEMVEQAELIMGIHTVRAALQQTQRVTELWVDGKRQDRRFRNLMEEIDALNLPVHQTTAHALDELVKQGTHQGVVARIRPPEVHDEAYLKALLKRLPTTPLLLVLDGVQDPHNLGACLRTADAVGVQALIAPRNRSVGLNATVCKVASGAALGVPFVQVVNLVRCLEWLQRQGVWLVGTAAEADLELYQADLRGPLAIVMGGEDKGLRRLTREHCDILVRLPMGGIVESLNVSVATGVALYEAVRQRQASPLDP